ncbi:MAG: DUF4124 domain-containing protein [Candidatus Competibacteraceae bacterium]|nr:DUF4124 domain-containing protein [Candidatus Competibacteraceae bacterium]
MRKSKPLRAVLAASLLSLAAFGAGATPPVWNATPFSYVAVNDDIAEVLRGFAASQGVPVVVSDKIAGKLNGRFDQLTPEAFLQRLVAAYGLVWYYDGHVLYVYRADEMRSRIVKLNFYPVARFQKALEQLGILDDRFTFKPVAEEGVVLVSGPQPFLDLVEEMGKTLDASFPVKATAQADAVYRWTDESGRVHYSSEPPPETARAIKTLAIEPTAAGRASGAAEMQRRVEDYNRYLQAVDGIKTAAVTRANVNVSPNAGAGALIAQTATAAGPKP